MKSKYEGDYFKAGAAETLGKDYEDVTGTERLRFKIAFFNVIGSETFQSRQIYEVREALRHQQKEWKDLEESGFPYASCEECSRAVSVIEREDRTWELEPHTCEPHVVCPGSGSGVETIYVENL